LTSNKMLVFGDWWARQMEGVRHTPPIKMEKSDDFIVYV
jgi:hypothetical protein